MRILHPLRLATLLAIASGAADAGAQASYVLDHGASHVRFRGRALLQSVTGNSESLRGTIVVRDNDLRTARGDVRFAVASLRTTPDAEAEEVERLFGGAAHPDIVFLVDSIVRHERAGRWRFDGRLLMNGVTRPVSFGGNAMSEGGRVVAEGEALVDVRKWGITPPTRLRGLLRMSPEMTLSFRAEFFPRDPRSATQIAVDH